MNGGRDRNPRAKVARKELCEKSLKPPLQQLGPENFSCTGAISEDAMAGWKKEGGGKPHE